MTLCVELTAFRRSSRVAPTSSHAPFHAESEPPARYSAVRAIPSVTPEKSVLRSRSLFSRPRKPNSIFLFGCHATPKPPDGRHFVAYWTAPEALGFAVACVVEQRGLVRQQNAHRESLPK